MRDNVRTNKRKTRDLNQPADTLERVNVLASGEFEVVSWLTAIGVLIAVVLAAAYPAFDPAAVLLGQFP